jgi:hypothetical protein
MKNASLWALTGAALVVGVAYACAVPVDVKGCPAGSAPSDCDVTLVSASEFGGPDASVAQGGGAGSSMNPPSGGSAGTSSPPAGGSSGNSPPVGGSAGQGQSGSAGSAGTAGTAGTAGAGGSAGSGAAGAGGSAGTAGTAGSAGTSAAGAGGTGAQSTFSTAACDFDDTTGCAQLACATVCPNNGYCPTNCAAILTCVEDNVDVAGCVTADDPMCGIRNGGTTKPCTMIVESSGGVNPTQNDQPAFVARALVNCLCSDPRP